MPQRKLPKLWKPKAGSAWHVYLGKRKVNLRTTDPAEADRRRRDLVAGKLTPETIPGAPLALPPIDGDENGPQTAPEALETAFETVGAPEVAKVGPEVTTDAAGGTAAAPDTYRSPEGWNAALGDTAAAANDTEAPPPPEVGFDGGELLDMAAGAITNFTETIARAVLLKRGKVPPNLGDDFPLKPLLRQSWAAQLRIWCPTDTALTPATGIMMGTLGMWAIMFAGSSPMTEEQKREAAQAAEEATKANAAA